MIRETPSVGTLEGETIDRPHYMLLRGQLLYNGGRSGSKFSKILSWNMTRLNEHQRPQPQTNTPMMAPCCCQILQNSPDFGNTKRKLDSHLH